MNEPAAPPPRASTKASRRGHYSGVTRLPRGQRLDQHLRSRLRVHHLGRVALVGRLPHRTNAGIVVVVSSSLTPPPPHALCATKKQQRHRRGTASRPFSRIAARAMANTLRLHALPVATHSRQGSPHGPPTHPPIHRNDDCRLFPGGRWQHCGTWQVAHVPQQPPYWPRRPRLRRPRGCCVRRRGRSRRSAAAAGSGCASAARGKSPTGPHACGPAPCAASPGSCQRNSSSVSISSSEQAESAE